MSVPSSRFTAIYDSLPIDAQKVLIEKHLIPLLNHIPTSRYRRVLCKAAHLRKRHTGIPVLDLKAKKREVSALIDELQRDTKRAFIGDRTQRTDLLYEIVDSVTDWLSDIWRVVYEHNVDFMYAHRCLLFIVGTLEHISHSGAGCCKCAFTNMHVSVALRSKSGKRVKTFDINGAQNLDEVLQYIWRDLFLSMLASGAEKQISQIPEMLDDIDELMGWKSLERILYGGKKCRHEVENMDSEESEDEDEDEDDSDFEDSEDEDEDLGCPGHDLSSARYPAYWLQGISNQMLRLRNLTEQAMTVIFERTPSLKLYIALISISTDPQTTELDLLRIMLSIATTCPEAFVAALDIYAHERQATIVVDLLNTHAHLLRPRDAPILQSAITMITVFQSHRQRGLQLIEKELLDTARAIRRALLPSFSGIDESVHQEELKQILRLRSGTTARRDRIDQWVEAVSTPGANTPHPMAFAAMMMGLPLMPGMDGSDEADPMGFLDLDPHDPDLMDLRDEFRPRLKYRFEGWVDTANTVHLGANILPKVYKDILEMMPFLRATDIVEEIINRLADRPSKHHVCDALDALSSFVKTQKRSANRHRTERPTASSSGSDPSSPTAPTPPAGGSLNVTFGGFHYPGFGGPSYTGTGSMEDVD